jgi:hypothetical protein
MNEEEAKKFLEELANDIVVEYGRPAEPIAEDLHKVIVLLQDLREELDSTWQMLEEMRLSDISNHKDVVSKEIDQFIKEKRKIAKVSEA